MPVYHLACCDCQKKVRRLLDGPETWGRLHCPCGGSYRRDAVGPTAKVVEVIDNGLMVRALERPADAERLRSEKAQKADPLAGQSRRQ